MKITFMNNFDNIISALKIQADRDYKQLIEKAISLGIEDFNYSTYDPQGLRYRIGEKLSENLNNETQLLRFDFYNKTDRGC